ncbi:hypothetical protein L596_023064 [Steinernema carpocapsae]|uniref:C6 domain-containing protein n=1 Tax=Steinernema carpocapsae TaxID=34508 RepID=A0A4U5MCJ1_STECR|nr:hypothetical protein L596_023064 [Steinernema carpocapsae]
MNPTVLVAAVLFVRFSFACIATRPTPLPTTTTTAAPAARDCRSCTTEQIQVFHMGDESHTDRKMIDMDIEANDDRNCKIRTFTCINAFDNPMQTIFLWNRIPGTANSVGQSEDTPRQVRRTLDCANGEWLLRDPGTDPLAIRTIECFASDEDDL